MSFHYYIELKLNEKEINESLVLAGLKSELIGEIEASLKANMGQMKPHLSSMKLKPLEYNNLEWRVDINLGSRSIREIVEPEIILKFDLKKGDEIATEVLKTDVVNLVHLTNSLDEALNEIKTHYVRRVLKNIV